MKKFFYVFVVLALLTVFVLIFAYINQEKLIDRYIENQSHGADFHYELLDDKESIVLVTVGTAAPLPSDRVQSCNAVFVNGKFFVFDAGEGALDKMEDLRLPLDRIDAVFISHWHSDHFIDLPGLINRSWQLGRVQDVHLYGPIGSLRIASAIDSLLLDENKYRVAHHGKEIMNPEYSSLIPHAIDSVGGDMMVIYDQDDIKISVFNVNHTPVEPSYGFRVDYRGKSLVFSGDTSYEEKLADYADGADILVHEAMQKDFISRASKMQKEMGRNRNSTILTDVLEYHTTPAEAAQIAEKAQVKKLILTHLAPSPGNPISRRFFRRGLDKIFKGPILLAEDGDIYTI
jgi:ribonuclease Z